MFLGKLIRVSRLVDFLALLYADTPYLVSGGGAAEVSPTFAGALWLLDYSLQAASTNISRSYFHQGTVDENSYAWWGSSSVRAAYYGAYAATYSLAGGRYISRLDTGHTLFGGYVIYSVFKKPIRIVLYNSEFFDGNSTRTIQDFVLTGLPGKMSTALRLTAKSALSRQDFGENPTFAGRTFSNTTCIANGQPIYEKVPIREGKATYAISASEALIVDINN
jgi:hypothetical protein